MCSSLRFAATPEAMTVLKRVKKDTLAVTDMFEGEMVASEEGEATEDSAFISSGHDEERVLIDGKTGHQWSLHRRKAASLRPSSYRCRAPRSAEGPESY